MKNLYFFQVNYSYGRTAHLPYTAALLSCYALADERIKNEYRLAEIFFLRDKPESFLEKIENPSFVGFSSYIWNFEFNKKTARLIKEKYPDCVIVFGGHHVVPGGSLLDEEPSIDYLIHGEGEDAFRRLMLVSLGLDIAADIPGVSYRSENGVVTNPSVIKNEEFIDEPSPYLEGYFDKILADYPEKDFMGLIETTRGCPNSCTYCDWSNMKSRIRKFPIQRVFDEIKWIGEHHILGLGSADSNFGIFERDEEITDYIVKTYLEYGYPKGYQTSYAKNSNDRIFRIGQKLEQYHLSKGITLSFQSMSDTVLENIGRKNISIAHYSELMNMYNAAGIATYTELILGMPGETYESFSSGIGRLLGLGQHNSIYIHNCEWLPCAVMGTPEYVEKFGIETSRILLNQPHIEPDGNDTVMEFSNLVVATKTMTREDWMNMNMLSFTVQAFHHMGVLQLFALYLHNEQDVDYLDFYEAIKTFLVSDSVVMKKAVGNMLGKLKSVAYEEKDASFVIQEDNFGRVHWPLEEYLFLSAVDCLDDLFEEIKPLLETFPYGENVFEELFSFQKAMIKRPFYAGGEINYGFNFCEYFRGALASKKILLKSGNYSADIRAVCYNEKIRWAKEVAWFGRKDKKNIYINDCTERENG